MFLMHVGCRVEKNGDIGTVKFIGSVPPTAGEWIGIEWDDPSRGKHDGSKDGVSYFTCKHSTGGSFVRQNVLNFGISMHKAVEERYTVTSDDPENAAMYFKNATGRLKKIEGVGMVEVQEEFKKLHTLKQIGLREQFISSGGAPGMVASLIPNVVELNLSKNLLSSWSVVCEIAKQLPKLKVLNLSENILSLDQVANSSSAFSSLHTLVLNRCSLTWQQVLKCSVIWPHICQLHLVGNHITDISSTDVFASLELLNLSENLIESWDEIDHLCTLPKLTTLFLNNCELSCMNVNPNEFHNLTHISLSGNRFESVVVFNEIDKFPALTRLNFKNNPVQSSEEYHTMLEIVVAKIKKLQVYNNTQITEQERCSSELDYLQKYGLEWKSSGGHQDPELNRPSEEFLQSHPRYMEIAGEYGFPGDHQLIRKSTAIKENLIEVMIEAPVKPEFKPIKRRLPLSMTVGNLKLFIQKLTKIEVRRQRLVYVSKDDDSYIVDLHRDFETLHDVSIEPLDRIQVRGVHHLPSGHPRRWKKQIRS